MTKPIKRLYKEAIANDLFISELKAADPEYECVSIFLDDEIKIIVSTIYMGWLISRKEYDESKYKK